MKLSTSLQRKSQRQFLDGKNKQERFDIRKFGIGCQIEENPLGRKGL